MNNRHNLHKEHEQGTARSYVVGFILALIFTLIPYHLVVSQNINGNKLLVTILGFAVAQLFVQVFFFLHLGRGPKPFYNVIFFFATVGIIVIAIGGSLFIMTNLYNNMSPGEVTTKLAQDEGIAQVSGQKTGACQGVKKNYIVTISKDLVKPTIVHAGLCDTLTFVNEDNKIREIAFGSHPSHEIYGGEYEEIVREGYPKTITLNQSGSYQFHDHLNPTVNGQFTVTP